jgi:hypothetical protein
MRGIVGSLLAVALCALLAPTWAQGVIASPDGVALASAPEQILAGPLGRQARLLDEVPGTPLDLEAARAKLAQGGFRPSPAAVPNLGNAAPPR